MLTIIGIGPGNGAFFFAAAAECLAQAEIVIGSSRQLALVAGKTSAVQKVLPKQLAELEIFLKANDEKALVLLASGDPLLYGIGNWATQRFQPENLRILPGISAIQYLFSALGLPLNDCYLTSSHGKQPDFALIYQLPKVALVTDAKIGPYELAQEMLKRGGGKRLIIGENLSYETEKIREFTAEKVPKEVYQMNVVVIMNEG